MDQKELYLKNNEMYDITRNLLILAIETYLDKPMEVWVEEDGTKQKIKKTRASGTGKLSYELSDSFILGKEEINEFKEPTICAKIFTDIVLKEYFNNSKNKQNEINHRINELSSNKRQIRSSIGSTDEEIYDVNDDVEKDINNNN